MRRIFVPAAADTTLLRRQGGRTAGGSRNNRPAKVRNGGDRYDFSGTGAGTQVTHWISGIAALLPDFPVFPRASAAAFFS